MYSIAVVVLIIFCSAFFFEIRTKKYRLHKECDIKKIDVFAAIIELGDSSYT